MLLQACERYLTHNKSQLNSIDNSGQTIEKLGERYVSPGFDNWINYEIKYLQRETQPSENSGRIRFISSDSEHLGANLSKSVLDDLTKLTDALLLRVVPETNQPISFDTKLKDYGSVLDQPLSLQIYTTLNQFRLLVPNLHSNNGHFGLHTHLAKLYPIFESWLKGLAVQELKATLANLNLSDEASIQAVEQQLANPITRDILTKNRQSQSEHILKILSVVTILIGVGIFPTLGLVFKRLYDSGGTSINFFKPLSKNLCEEAATITSSIENSPQQSQF